LFQYSPKHGHGRRPIPILLVSFYHQDYRSANNKNFTANRRRADFLSLPLTQAAACILVPRRVALASCICLCRVPPVWCRLAVALRKRTQYTVGAWLGSGDAGREGQDAMTQSAVAAQRPSVAWRVVGVFSGLLGGLGWVLLLGILAFIVPRFEEIFARFQVTGGLPWVTAVIIQLSHAVRNWWFLFGPAAAAVLAAPLVGCIWTRTPGGVIAAVVFGMVSVLAVAVGITVIVLGLFMPLVVDIQSVGNKM